VEPTNKPIAVIVGDVVDSTKLTSAQFEQLLKRIKSIQTWISEGHSENAHSIERGDEFQSVVHDIENALRYTVIYRIGIKALGKAFDSRISFAIAANADLRESVSESMGQAFVLSGRGLSGLKNDRLLFSSDSIALTEYFDLLFKYLDKQLNDLTASQGEVKLPKIRTKEDLASIEVADRLHVATAAVSNACNHAGGRVSHAVSYRCIHK